MLMNDNTCVTKLIRAETFFSRGIGLLGRGGLPEGEGLLIKPCYQVHTMFMRFTIDVVFLDKSDCVIEICRGLRPWRISPIVWKAKSVLEMGNGGADRIQIGDQLKITNNSVLL
jgi:uncharacterized protein